MADICNQNLESNILFGAQHSEKEMVENTQVPEQNQELQNSDILSQSETQSQYSPKEKAGKLERNNQQPNQDEIQSAKSKIAQESPQLQVVQQNSHTETVQESPRFKSVEEESPKIQAVEESPRHEVSEQSPKAQVTAESAALKVSEEENVTETKNTDSELNTIHNFKTAEAPLNTSNEGITFGELLDLRSRVDRILSQSIANTYHTNSKANEVPLRSSFISGQTHQVIAGSTNPYSKPMTSFYSSQTFTTYNYLVNHNTQITPQIRHISDVYPTEKSSSRASYLHATSEFKPNYDKQKLDAIVSRVMSTKNVINAIKPINTYSSDIYINNNLRKESILQSQSAHALGKSIATTKKVTNALENPKRSYCGTIEDDVESVVMPQADEYSQIYDDDDEHVGRSQNTIEEKPKEHKTPKRLEINNARKQRLGASAVQVQNKSNGAEITQEKLTKSQVDDVESSSESYQKSSKNYLLVSPKKISVSHHRQHGRQNSMGWSATILESPSKARISTQKL